MQDAVTPTDTSELFASGIFPVKSSRRSKTPVLLSLACGASWATADKEITDLGKPQVTEKDGVTRTGSQDLANEYFLRAPVAP